MTEVGRLWRELLGETNTVETLLASCNLIGSIYTLLIGYYIYTKIESIEVVYKSVNFWAARTSLALILLGCSYNALLPRIPSIPETGMMAGFSLFLTYVALILKRGK